MVYVFVCAQMHIYIYRNDVNRIVCALLCKDVLCVKLCIALYSNAISIWRGVEYSIYMYVSNLTWYPCFLSLFYTAIPGLEDETGKSSKIEEAD